MRRALIGAIVAVSAAVFAVACVSERTSSPDNPLEGCNAQLPADAIGSTIVAVRDFNFTPSTIRIRPGTKVTWVNCGAPSDQAHTSTADGGQWSSNLLAPGATYTREFAETGSFPYHCEPHPFMKGTVVVE